MTLYDKLTDPRTTLYKKLESMIKEAEKLEAKAKRIKELNYCLVNRIQCEKIWEEADIDCALSWLQYSDLPVDEILKKIT